MVFYMFKTVLFDFGQKHVGSADGFRATGKEALIRYYLLKGDNLNKTVS